MKPFEGVEGIFQAIKSQGLPMGILTSNTFEIVGKFLDKHNWRSYFPLLERSGRINGKSKVLKKILQEHGWKAEETIYIGDEARDIVAANKTDMPSIAVTWGLNTRRLLAKQNPTYIVETPAKLGELLGQLTVVNA